jgi:probable HAF family extracellular repeat protein
MMGLEFPQVFAVSFNGSIVAGFRLLRGESEPIFWTQREGIVGLGKPAGYAYGDVSGMSADGSVIVGTCVTESGTDSVAFRWTKDSGTARIGPLPDAIHRCEAHAVSADGRVVVGAIWHDADHCEAFRWTSQTGVVGLGHLPGHSCSVALGVSADGAVIVGSCDSGGRYDAFRWSVADGMTGLNADSRFGTIANAVSADGTVMVGECQGRSGRQAIMWDSNWRMRTVREVLTNNLGLRKHLDGWELTSANAISADGRVVVGAGSNPNGNTEAWVARLGRMPAE